MSAIGSRTMASDEWVDAFLTRPIEGEWPYLWINATYPKVDTSAYRLVAAL